MGEEYNIVDRLEHTNDSLEDHGYMLRLANEAASLIQELGEALEIAEGVLSNVPYEFETTNGGRIPVTKASEARDRARAILSKLKGA